jgi:hypothetical protein
VLLVARGGGGVRFPRTFSYPVGPKRGAVGSVRGFCFAAIFSKSEEKE